jgi:hypothetical protein
MFRKSENINLIQRPFGLKKGSIIHPYFLSGLIKIMDHITAVHYQDVKLK